MKQLIFVCLLLIVAFSSCKKEKKSTMTSTPPPTSIGDVSLKIKMASPYKNGAQSDYIYDFSNTHISFNNIPVAMSDLHFYNCPDAIGLSIYYNPNWPYGIPRNVGDTLRITFDSLEYIGGQSYGSDTVGFNHCMDSLTIITHGYEAVKQYYSYGLVDLTNTTTDLSTDRKLGYCEINQCDVSSPQRRWYLGGKVTFTFILE